MIIRFTAGGTGSTPNPVRRALCTLGLFGKHSHNKFIPDVYKYNSKAIRLELIRGLLDTDGWVDHNGQPRLEQTSKRLAEDFREVIQSLGGMTTWREKMGAYRVAGVQKETRLIYRQAVLITDAKELFTLPAKQNKARRRHFPVRRTIHRVEPTRMAEAQCIQISDPRGLYLTDQFIATHNTTCSGIIAVEAFLGIGKWKTKRRVLYAAPTIDQVEKFWTEVKRALEAPLRFKQLYKNETRHIIQGTAVQETTDLSKAGDYRIRAKTAFNAQTLRGDYCDVLILDEFQMMDETALEEVGLPMLMDNNGDLIIIYTPPSVKSRSASKAKDPMHAAKLYRQCQQNPSWLCVHFPSHANPHISQEGIAEASRGMTSLAYRQEILAEDIDEVPGALWKREWLENNRVARYNLLT